MNSKFLLLAIGIAGLTGCATSYKTGQTPDDVYFSPAPKYVETETVKDEEETRQEDYYDYRDRAARMKANNYRKWNSLDDPYYFDNYSYSPSYKYRYNYSYGYSYNYNPFAYNTSGYYGNHYGYGGYCCCYNNTGYTGYNYTNPIRYAYTPVKPVYRAPRGGGNTGYSNSNYSNTNNGSSRTKSGSTLGGTLNRVFNNGNSGTSSSSSSPVRTYEPSSSSSNNNSSNNNSGSSSSSSSGSSSSSSTPVSRPARNGN